MPDKTIGLGIPLPLLTGQDGLDQQVEYGNLLELNRSLARYLKRDNVVVTETVKNPQSRYPEDLSGKEPWPCAELPQQYACKITEHIYIAAMFLHNIAAAKNLT